MREKLYNIIEPRSKETKLSRIYDAVMIGVICLSLIPLLFKETNLFFQVLDYITVSVFIIDYFLRLITADYKYMKHNLKSFVRYPFSPMAIIDLLSILPSITPLHAGFKALRVLRLLRALRVIRVLRYSKSVQIIRNVFIKQKDALLTILGFALGYVFLSALIMFQVEPQTFNNFFDAIYWATISLTTVGYGDIFAVTTIGRTFTMISAFVGIAIVALPAGIVTAGYMEELQDRNESKPDSNKE